MLCNGLGDGLVLIRQHTMNWVIMHMITFPYMMCPEELIPINRHVGPSQPNSQFIVLLCLAMMTVLLQWQPDMHIWNTWGAKGRKSHCQYHLHITKSQGIIRNGIPLNIYIYMMKARDPGQAHIHTHAYIAHMTLLMLSLKRKPAGSGSLSDGLSYLDMKLESFYSYAM